MVETGERRDTKSKIVDVTARLLREQGPTAVTTRRVAEAAGMQAPAIYRLFGDKDGLLDAVAEHVMATYVDTKAATVQAAVDARLDPLDDLRAGWQTQIEFGLANPTLFRLLSDPDRVIDSPAARAGRQVLASRVHRLALAGRLRVDEQRAVDLIHAAGTGAVQTLLSMAADRRDHGLADSMLDAVLGQILIKTGERVADTRSAALVALRALAPDLDVLSDSERQLLCEWLDRAIAAR